MYENPAVVIGGGVNGLGVIRNLGRSGVDVYCVVENKNEAVYSRYCKEYFIFPRAERGSQELMTFLNRFKRRLSSEAVLFPTSDISILNVSSLIDEIDSYLAPVSNPEVIETLVKKRKFYDSLIKKEVPHPLTLFPDLENLKEIVKKVSYPVFVKPSMSQTFFKKFGKKGFVAKSEKELNQHIKLMEKYQIDVMVQEIVSGPPTNHYFIDGYLDKNSRPLALFARRRLRMWPLSFGNSTACVSVPIPEVVNMKEAIMEYLASIGFRGIFSAEFKRDPRDGVGKLLEVNARSWWYNSFPSACGVNIILTAYLEAIGKDVKSVQKYETGINLIYFTEDLKWLLATFVQGKPSFREWLSSIIGKKDWVVLAKDDPNPFIMNIERVAADFANRKRIRC
ncbi:MAG: hypothetical protein PVF15_08745 [Candidatus Bathyarchaeota archaeon]|jgi:predicted ATP-grasp superfamily ATP-dependent carboligase